MHPFKDNSNEKKVTDYLVSAFRINARRMIGFQQHVIYKSNVINHLYL